MTPFVGILIFLYFPAWLGVELWPRLRPCSKKRMWISRLTTFVFSITAAVVALFYSVAINLKKYHAPDTWALLALALAPLYFAILFWRLSRTASYDRSALRRTALGLAISSIPVFISEYLLTQSGFLPQG
jgi:Na+/proline symporter